MGRGRVGKSHLLRALARRWMDAGEQVAWYDPTTPLPWAWLPQASLLLLMTVRPSTTRVSTPRSRLRRDGRPRRRHRRQRRPTCRWTCLREDLRTCLGWGPSYALVHLGEAETRPSCGGKPTAAGCCS